MQERINNIVNIRKGEIEKKIERLYEASKRLTEMKIEDSTTDEQLEQIMKLEIARITSNELNKISYKQRREEKIKKTEKPPKVGRPIGKTNRTKEENQKAKIGRPKKIKPIVE